MFRGPRRLGMNGAIEIGDAVAAANWKLKLLGLSDTTCIVYAQGKAEVIDLLGRVCFEFEDEDPEVACEVAYGHVELSLFLLLRGMPPP